jgi:hypothetical protein
MQPTILFIVTLAMVMPTLAVPRLDLSFEAVNQGLIDGPIHNLDIRASNIHLMLSRLSAATKIPVGLEVSPNDDLMLDREMKLQIHNGTFRTALDSLVKQNPLYTWKIQDGVVNVLPTDPNRDHLIRAVLETKLKRLNIKRGMSRFALRQTVTAMSEVQLVLAEENVHPENQSFMSRDFDPLGKNFSLEVSNVSVTEVLNRVIRDSQTNYWVVLRQGERKEHFVLNL